MTNKSSWYKYIWKHLCNFSTVWASLVAQTVKRLPTTWETRVRCLDQEDPLEKEMATHSSILAWKIPLTEEPGRLQFMGLQRVGHNWVSEVNGTELANKNYTMYLPVGACAHPVKPRKSTCLPLACNQHIQQFKLSPNSLCMNIRIEWGGIPFWSSDSAFSLPRACVWSLVRKLRSHKPFGGGHPSPPKIVWGNRKGL